MPQEIVDNIRIEGAIGTGDILTFDLQQRISSSAKAGNNLILAGDAVGNNHWSVGGGMQIGAVSHQERLKRFVKQDEIVLNDRVEHLQDYSSGAINRYNSLGRSWRKIAIQWLANITQKNFIIKELKAGAIENHKHQLRLLEVY